LRKTATTLPLHYFTICIMCDRTGHQFTIQENIAHLLPGDAQREAPPRSSEQAHFLTTIAADLFR
jgi:hypothetical protein